MYGFTLDQYGGLKSIVPIDVDPRTKQPIVPAGVMVSPELPDVMTLDEGHRFVLGTDGQWHAMENHVGELYWPADAKWGDQPKRMAGYGPLPEGSSTTPPAEPTPLERFLDSIKDMDDEELRSHLYSSQRYRFIDDDIAQGPSDVAMCLVDGKAMTVDETSQQWIRYFGDDDTKAQAALEQKTAAKTYIRTAVAAYFNKEV